MAFEGEREDVPAALGVIAAAVSFAVVQAESIQDELAKLGDRAGTPVETEGAADDIPEPQAANKSAAIIASGVRPACMFTSAII